MPYSTLPASAHPRARFGAAAPTISELTYSTIDVLDEEPERLGTADFSELREDMD